MKNFAKKMYWVLSTQFGIDPRKMIRSIRGIFYYISDWKKFRKNYRGEINLLPCLHDRFEEGGSTKNEYFWQDLHVAQKIHDAKPMRHVDIGSRIDGFVAHVASFREIEVFDIRPIASSIPKVVFKQADLMNPIAAYLNYCDSLSCLHALEHFGLGRYGDPIDPSGYEAGFKNMIGILKPGGTFYLAVPIGRERVEFNAHRVFDPKTFAHMGRDHGLKLMNFDWIGLEKVIMHATDCAQAMEDLSKHDYALGIYTFSKI